MGDTKEVTMVRMMFWLLVKQRIIFKRDLQMLAMVMVAMAMVVDLDWVVIVMAIVMAMVMVMDMAMADMVLVDTTMERGLQMLHIISISEQLNLVMDMAMDMVIDMD